MQNFRPSSSSLSVFKGGVVLPSHRLWYAFLVLGRLVTFVALNCFITFCLVFLFVDAMKLNVSVHFLWIESVSARSLSAYLLLFLCIFFSIFLVSFQNRRLALRCGILFRFCFSSCSGGCVVGTVCG